MTSQPHGCRTGVSIRNVRETFLCFRLEEQVPGGGKARDPTQLCEVSRRAEHLSLSSQIQRPFLRLRATGDASQIIIEFGKMLILEK